MPRACILLAAALLALSATQSEAAPPSSNFGDNFRRLMKAVVESSESRGENTESFALTQIVSLVGDEQSFVENYLERVEKVLSKLGVRSTGTCIAALETELFRLKGMSSFITCANLTQAIFNMKQITSATFDVLTKLFTVMKTDLDGLDKCFPFKTEANWKCVDKFFWQCFDSGKSLLKIVETYAAKVKNLSVQIKEEIDICLHPVTDFQSEIANLMKVFITCSMSS